jgi:hypothetical protein
MEYIGDNFWMEKDMEKVNLFGIMDKLLMEIGLKVKKMGKEFGHHLTVIIIMDSGKIIVKMGKVIIFIHLSLNTKVNLKIS